MKTFQKSVRQKRELKHEFNLFLYEMVHRGDVANLLWVLQYSSISIIKQLKQTGFHNCFIFFEPMKKSL